MVNINDDIRNYDISENLVLNVINGQNGKWFLSCDIYDNGIFNRVDFELIDNKLKIVYVDTDIKNIEVINYKFQNNYVNVVDGVVSITLDAVFKCNDDYSFNINFSKTLGLDETSKSRYSIFDKLDNKFCLRYIKDLIKSKQLYGSYDFIYENVDKILEFIKMIEKSRIEIFKNNLNVSCDLEEGIKTAQEFLDEMNIDINIIDLINDGTIVFDNENKNSEFSGLSTFDYEKNKRIIYINQTNDLTMIAVLIHELLHYYNQPIDNNRSLVSAFLTEITSYGYELIFLDKCISEKYKSHAEDIFRWVINSLSSNAFQSFSPIFSLSLYKNNNLTLEEIEKKMNLDNYFDEMKSFVNSGKAISKNLWDILGFYLGIYCYVEYKKDSSFSNKMLEFSNKMNSETFSDCLKIIDLNDTSEVVTKGLINLEEYASFVNNFKSERCNKTKLLTTD